MVLMDTSILYSYNCFLHIRTPNVEYVVLLLWGFMLSVPAGRFQNQNQSCFKFGAGGRFHLSGALICSVPGRVLPYSTFRFNSPATAFFSLRFSRSPVKDSLRCPVDYGYGSPMMNSHMIILIYFYSNVFSAPAKYGDVF